MICCIYRLISPSGKSYIGQTINFKRRIARHKNPKVKDCPKLNNAIKKYGFQNFQIEIIEHCLPRLLNDRERYWISYYNSLIFGYNSTSGGNSNYIILDETKEKIRQKNKGRYHGNQNVKCIIDGITYNSIGEASRNLGIPFRNIRHRLNSKNIKYNNYSYIDKQNPVRSKRNLCHSKSCIINGVEYQSIRDAAKALNVHPSTLSYRLKNKPLSKKDKSCVINNVTYKSISEASRVLGISHSTLSYRLKNGLI